MGFPAKRMKEKGNESLDTHLFVGYIILEASNSATTLKLCSIGIIA
jgi:hypothetical protein